MELKNQILVDRCHILNIQIRNNLEECENAFCIIRQFPLIQEFVEWRASNDTLNDEFALLSPSEQVEGSFYTEKLNSTSLYQEVLQYFLSISSKDCGESIFSLDYAELSTLTHGRVRTQDFIIECPSLSKINYAWVFWLPMWGWITSLRLSLIFQNILIKLLEFFPVFLI